MIASGPLRATGKTGSQKGSGWMFPVTAGVFTQVVGADIESELTIPAGSAGVHYSWGEERYWGVDFIILGGDIGAGPGFPVPGLAITDQERVHTHLFNFLVLPMAIFGGKGVMFWPGYGYAFHRFLLHLNYPFWISDGGFGSPGMFIGAGYTF